MNKEIVLPDLGEGIDSAEISEVVVKEGDIVGPDDIILILESEKASMEIPAEVSGEIKEILVKAGQEVKTGQLLITVDLTDADPSLEESNSEITDKKGDQRTDNNGMPAEIVLPDLGEGIDSAEISEVVVKEGDIVGPDDIILILESEKASMEIPAEVSGEIKEILVKAGQEVKTGQLLITVDLTDADPSLEESNSEITDKKGDQRTDNNGMPAEIVLPDLGEGIDSAEISEVVVKEGDIVGPDDIILILESEKASMEIPAEVSGEIKEILVKAGQEVKTGQLLIRVKEGTTKK